MEARTVSIRHSTWISGFLVGLVIAVCSMSDARAEAGPAPASARPAPSPTAPF